MRATIRCAIWIASIAVSAMAARPLSAGDWLSPYLAKVQGLLLFVMVDGKAPCDFVRERLLTSAIFLLNSSGIPFDAEPETKEGEDRSSWGMLAIEAHALDVKTGCVWTTESTLYAWQEGGTMLGLPVDSRSSIVWTRSAFGAANGNGLTDFVSKYQENQIKELVNDMHASRKKFPE